MGHDLNNIREPDMRAVAKRLVTASAPCTAELGALMDCMKRNSAAAESACAKERAALASCAGRHTGTAQATQLQKRQLAQRLQAVATAAKRFGY